MTIQYTLLGLLSWQPFSGYDLKKIISESDLFYWSGNNNQIYNSLIQLHKEGLVTQQVQYQESLPAKKIYSITQEGRARLRQWVLSEPELPEVHNNFLIQLAWAGQLAGARQLAGAEIDALLGKYEAEITVQLRMRQARAAEQAALPRRTVEEQFLAEKIAENILATYQHELDWARRVRQELQEKILTT